MREVIGKMKGLRGELNNSIEALKEVILSNKGENKFT